MSGKKRTRKEITKVSLRFMETKTDDENDVVPVWGFKDTTWGCCWCGAESKDMRDDFGTSKCLRCGFWTIHEDGGKPDIEASKHMSALFGLFQMEIDKRQERGDI